MPRARAIRRHFDRTGAILFRRRLRRDAVMQSLVFTCIPCSNRECKCRIVTLKGFLYEGEVTGACLEDGNIVTTVLKDTVRASHQIRFWVDVDTGLVTPVRDQPLDEAGRVAMPWLEDELDGPFLEDLANRLLAAKKHELPEDRWRTTDWSWWQPDLLVPWRDVFAEARMDVYVLDKRAFLAVDYHHASTQCTCGHVQVAFYELFAEGRPKVSGHVYVNLPDDLSGTYDGPPEMTDLALRLWEAFRRRHDVAEHLGRRHQQIREVWPQVQEILPRRAPEPVGMRWGWPQSDELTPTPAQPQAPVPKVGRNEACPCGSGKKYKRCCGR